MSRRDTIIIAVLINAGLLLILFATAISSTSEEETHTVASTMQIAAAEETPPLTKESIPTVPGDEVDQLLSQWNSYPSSTVANSRPSPTGSQNAASNSPVTLGYQSDARDDSSKGVQPSLQQISPEPKRSSSNNTYKEVTVKRGDVLDRIAKANGTSVQEIMRANQLTSTQLKVGQVLKIPVKSTGDAPVVSETKAASSNQAQYYVVKSGDNPWLIAKKNHLALDELLRLNNLDETSARRLQPGDKIRIR